MSFNTLVKKHLKQEMLFMAKLKAGDVTKLENKLRTLKTDIKELQQILNLTLSGQHSSLPDDVVKPTLSHSLYTKGMLNLPLTVKRKIGSKKKEINQIKKRLTAHYKK